MAVTIGKGTKAVKCISRCDEVAVALQAEKPARHVNRVRINPFWPKMAKL